MQESGLQGCKHFCHRSVTQSCLTLCDPMECSTPGFPTHHQLLELIQAYVHWVSDAIQPSNPLSHPSPLALNLFQHQSLFQGISSSHQVAKVLECQLQHQFFQWLFRVRYPLRLTWFHLLAVQGTLKEFSPAPQFKSINSLALSLLYV